MVTVGKAIRQLKNFKKQHIVLDVWCENDVLDFAKDNDIKLTRKQAREVIDRIENDIDCSTGVNWNTIEDNINEVLNKQKKNLK